MKVWQAAFGVLAVALGCNTTTEVPDENASGKIQLNLLGTDSRGAQYRLRDATFAIQGYPEYPMSGIAGGMGMGAPYYTEVSSETDLASATITQRVLPGFYSVLLTSNEWYLEHLTPGGPERVEQAVLLEASQYGYVYDGSTTTFTYRFGVDGELIDFRSGNVEINIEIERPEDPPGGGGSGGGYGGGSVAGGGPGGWGLAGNAVGGGGAI